MTAATYFLHTFPMSQDTRGTPIGGVVDRCHDALWKLRRRIRYDDMPILWNAVTAFLCMVALSVWLFVYTDWIPAIAGAVAFGGISAVVIVFGWTKAGKKAEKFIAALLARPEWLGLPLAGLCAWLVSLLWGTMAIHPTADLGQDVVILHSARTGATRRVTVEKGKTSKVRLPLWESRVWTIEADDYPQPPKKVGSFVPAEVLVPFDLLAPQVYIRPTPVLSKSAPSRHWRLIVKKNSRIVTEIRRYRGEGLLFGGNFRGRLSYLPEAGVVPWPDVSFGRDDLVEVIVERWENEHWKRYTSASATVGPFGEHKLREIEIDVPINPDVDDGDDADGGDAAGGPPSSSV